MCQSIFMYISKLGQYVVLSVGTLQGLADLVVSKIAGYEKCVVPFSSDYFLQISVCVYSC